jgi:hypothetical protein
MRSLPTQTQKNKHNTLIESTILRALYKIADLIFTTAPEILPHIAIEAAGSTSPSPV